MPKWETCKACENIPYESDKYICCRRCWKSCNKDPIIVEYWIQRRQGLKNILKEVILNEKDK